MARSDPERRIVQIAASCAAVGGSDFDYERERTSLSLDLKENIYALDSDGVMWQWFAGDHDNFPGWEALAQPWNDLRKARR